MTKRLETQALNALRRAGIQDLYQNLSPEELLKVPGLGPKGVEYLKRMTPKNKQVDKGLTIV